MVYLKEKPKSKQSSFLFRSIYVRTVHIPIRTKTSTTKYLILCGIRIKMPHIYNRPYYLSQKLKKLVCHLVTCQLTFYLIILTHINVSS